MLALAGVAAAILVAATGVTGLLGQLQEFTTPGGAAVRLEPGQKRGLYVPTATGAGVQCTVAGPDGRPVPPSPTSAGTTYTVNEYTAFASFTARAGGLHRVRCTSSSSVRAAVGPEPSVGDLFRGFALVLVLALGGLALAAIAFTTIILLRRKDRRRREQTA